MLKLETSSYADPGVLRRNLLILIENGSDVEDIWNYFKTYFAQHVDHTDLV